MEILPCLLVVPIFLPIRLAMEPRREVASRPDKLAESLSVAHCELGAPVHDHFAGETVELNHMLKKKFRCVGLTGKGDQMDCLREHVHECADSVAGVDDFHQPDLIHW